MFRYPIISVLRRVRASPWRSEIFATCRNPARGRHLSEAADSSTPDDALAVTMERQPSEMESSELHENLKPSQVVQLLDRHIVGQKDAKRAVAIAMRNRWRRKQLDDELRKEITPRNVLLVGPTGSGKTEVARRMAQLNDAPFRKM